MLSILFQEGNKVVLQVRESIEIVLTHILEQTIYVQVYSLVEMFSNLVLIHQYLPVRAIESALRSSATRRSAIA